MECNLATLGHFGEPRTILRANDSHVCARVHERPGLHLGLIILSDDDATTAAQIKVNRKIAHETPPACRSFMIRRPKLIRPAPALRRQSGPPTR